MAEIKAGAESRKEGGARKFESYSREAEKRA